MNHVITLEEARNIADNFEQIDDFDKYTRAVFEAGYKQAVEDLQRINDNGVLII